MSEIDLISIEEIKEFISVNFEEHGPQGAPGPQGPQGPIGATGFKGDKGDKGDQGEHGITLGNIDGGDPEMNYTYDQIIDGGDLNV